MTQLLRTSLYSILRGPQLHFDATFRVPLSCRVPRPQRLIAGIASQRAQLASSQAAPSTEGWSSEATDNVNLSNSWGKTTAKRFFSRRAGARKRNTKSLQRPICTPESDINSSQLPIRDSATIITQLQSFLKTSPTPNNLREYLTRRLHDGQIRIIDAPHHFYHDLIQHLVEHGFHQEALWRYQQMITEYNFIPLPQTRAQVLALSLAHLCKTDKDIITALESVVQDSEYTENDFMDLLDTLGELDVPLGHIVRVAEHFVKARGDGFVPNRILKTKLVKTQLRAGNLDAALDMSARTEEGTPQPITAEHYAEVLKLFARVNPRDKDGITKVLEAMEARGVSPDIHVFNAMLLRELRRRSLRGTFRTYRTLISIYHNELADVKPNEETFGLLFAAIVKLFKGPIFVQLLATREVMSPRAVYRDLLFFQKHDGVTITPRLLTKALEAFMAQRDYAGAHVVLKSFFIFKIPITIAQYHVIVRHIIRRLRFEIKSLRYRGEIRWADRFLDIPDMATLAQAQKLAIDRHEASKILRAAGAPEFKLDGYLLGSQKMTKRKYKMPTAGMVAGVEPVPKDLRLSDVPLLRLLRRSINATMYLVALGDPKATFNGTVSDVIAQAKLDIRPRLLFKSGWSRISKDDRWPEEDGSETEEDNPT